MRSACKLNPPVIIRTLVEAPVAVVTSIRILRGEYVYAYMRHHRHYNLPGFSGMWWGSSDSGYHRVALIEDAVIKSNACADTAPLFAPADPA